MGWAEIGSPIGELSVAADGVGVCAVRFPPAAGRPRPVAGPGGVLAETGVLAEAVAQLRAWFAGRRTEFDLPLSVSGGTEFDRAVWTEIARIPYGGMRTYGEIAAALGDTGAARAVGVACNRNPLPLLVPCHRVVGAGGRLVGFGGGLARKRWLLEHEARVAMQRAWI